MGILTDIFFGPTRSEPSPEDYRVYPRRNKPIYCARCGKYIANVYAYEGEYYGRQCWELAYAEAKAARKRQEEEQSQARLDALPRYGSRCPKCGNTLGVGVTRCWTQGCDYVVLLP